MKTMYTYLMAFWAERFADSAIYWAEIGKMIGEDLEGTNEEIYFWHIDFEIPIDMPESRSKTE